MKKPVQEESLVWAHLGDLHDRKPGDLWAFYQGLKLPPIPYTVAVKGYRCLFLDVVSHGSGGPDFALGQAQLEWLSAELESAESRRQRSIVFMHAYPADLKRDGDAMRRLLKEHRVMLVDMGHTHYNELANDGTTIFATTRSTGQIEEGPVGPPAEPFKLIVEATDSSGQTDSDSIRVAVPGFSPAERAADGSDADAIEAWPERHLLGTRLGPNRNGRQW